LIAQRKKLTVHSTTHERIIRLSNNAKKRVDCPLLFDNNKKKKKKKKKKKLDTLTMKNYQITQMLTLK